MDSVGLVGLLYRAARTEHDLAGVLAVRWAAAVEQRLDRRLLERLSARHPGPVGRSFQGFDPVAAPGRADHRRPFRQTAGLLDPDLGRMLHPAWLLVGCEVTPVRSEDTGARRTVAATAVPRPFAAAGRRLDRESLLSGYDLLVDAELGILLRVVEYFEGEVCRTLELEGVVLDPPAGAATGAAEATEADAAGFADFDADVPAPVRLVAKGVGAVMGEAVRLSTRIQGQQPAAEDDAPWFEEEPAEPAGSDEALPGDDALAWLLHRSGREARPFAAELHAWTDTKVLFHRAQEARATAPLLGRLLGPDAVWAAVGEVMPDRQHTVHRLLFADLLRYRLDVLLAPVRRSPTALACDGIHGYRLYPDRLVRVAPTPPEFAQAQLLDVAWLLGHDLTAEGWVEHGGRRALRITVSSRPRAIPSLELLFPRLEVLVDAELGVALRSTAYQQDGAPVARHELRGLWPAEPDEGAFRPAPPAGGRTMEGTAGLLGDSPLPAPLKAAAGAAGLLAGGAALLAGLFGNRTPSPEPPADSAADRPADPPVGVGDDH